MIEMKNINLSFKNHILFKNQNISIPSSQITVITGESGSGKSTLVNNISTIDIPTNGSLYILNQEVKQMSENQLGKFRYQYLGFIFQNYNLIGNLTVLENITLPIELDGNEIPYDFINEILHVLKLEDKKNIYHPHVYADK